LKAFNQHTLPQLQELHQLLLLDGHESHVSISFIEYCQSHNIIALCLSSHVTHLLQLLNVEIFEPLSKAYKKHIYTHSHFEAVTVIKLNFLFYYQKARSEGFFRQNILSAWQFTGLISYNPDTVISKLSCSKTSFYATFINENEVQINVSVTPHTVTQINKVVSVILKGITSSLHACVLNLKNTTLTAVMNRTVL